MSATGAMTPENDVSGNKRAQQQCAPTIKGTIFYVQKQHCILCKQVCPLLPSVCVCLRVCARSCSRAHVATFV